MLINSLVHVTVLLSDSKKIVLEIRKKLRAHRACLCQGPRLIYKKYIGKINTSKRFVVRVVNVSADVPESGRKSRTRLAGLGKKGQET